MTTETKPWAVFDRAAVRRHRERAARSAPEHDFLFREVADRLAERLDDIARQFPLALALGCRGGIIGSRLAGRGGIETLIESDLSAAMVARARDQGLAAARHVCLDEEALPFAERCFDLVLGAHSLHWVNDMPGALVQIRRALKPDGLFLAALFTGDTLIELRRAFLEAEAAEEGGASPRTASFAELADLGALLQRAGFALPVVDADTLTVTYDDAFALMRDLRLMGEANAAQARRRSFTRRATVMAAAARYRELFASRDGRIPATFEIATLTAWAPAASQPKPLRPGSAAASLAEALETTEIPAGDKARPGRGH